MKPLLLVCISYENEECVQKRIQIRTKGVVKTTQREFTC